MWETVICCVGMGLKPVGLCCEGMWGPDFIFQSNLSNVTLFHGGGWRWEDTASTFSGLYVISVISLVVVRENWLGLFIF